ncbi:biotin/lipoyl-containing protein, partial [Streptomyces sp. O3]
MAQVLEFKLPDLGEGLTEAEIVRWLVAVGDVVAVDQPVVEVETAKAMVEVPCPYAGVVTARFGAEGTELPVGAPLLTVAVGAAAEAADSGRPDAGPGAGVTDAGRNSGATDQAGHAPGRKAGDEPGGEAEGSGNVLVGYGTGTAPARRRRVRPASAVGTPSAPAARPDTAPGAPAGRSDAGPGALAARSDAALGAP